MEKGSKPIPMSEIQVEMLRIPDLSSCRSKISYRMKFRTTRSGKPSESSNQEDIQQPGGMEPQGAMLSYSDGVMSLGDALAEGSGSNVHWSARVAAFTYIQKLLQQGSKSSHEVTQNFERIMKFLSMHLTTLVGK